MSSRLSVAPQRDLSLPEELEKLEQSITLTLQEIDHNFSRAHQAVTQTILPVVEQYAKHSEAVWEGSKFWKQFFEASANVSLNGYEETPTEADTTTTAPTDATVTDDSQATPYSSSYASPPQPHDPIDFATPQPSADGDTDDLSTTPRPARRQPHPRSPPAPSEPSMTAPYDSPYEKLRREMLPHPSEASPSAASSLPRTPGTRSLSQSCSPSLSASTSTASRSGILDASKLPPSPVALPSARRTPRAGGAHPDALLHRVLDRTYRVQATPRGPQARLPRPHPHGHASARRRPGGGATTTLRGLDLDSSPMEAAPQLRSEMLVSPAKGRGRAGAREERERVPGVSVLTPMREGTGAPRGVASEWEDEDDEDEGGLPRGMSPPKTMPFRIPQSRLLQTPAREASKRIVDGLLLSAGGRFASDDDGGGGGDLPESPSIVGKRAMLEEDTF